MDCKYFDFERTRWRLFKKRVVLAKFYIYIFTRVSSTAGEQLVPDGIFCPVVSYLALTWFFRYIFDWNLQSLNHVIIIKTKVLFLQRYATLTDLGYSI